MDELDKPDLSAFMPEGWTGKYPPCQIQVSPDGEMSSQGRPMVHPTIISSSTTRCAWRMATT